MSFRYAAPVLRAAVLIGIAGYISKSARGYFIDRLSIPSEIYGFGVALFLVLVFSLSTKRLVDMLRVDASMQPARELRPKIVGNDYVQQVHKFPSRVGYLILIFEVFLLSLPYLSALPDRGIAPATYFVCIGAAGVVAIMGIYIFRYRVTVTSDQLVIRAFSTFEVPFTDIESVRVVTTKTIPPVGSRGVLALKDGRIIQLNGMLTGFDNLVAALMVKISKSAC